MRTLTLAMALVSALCATSAQAQHRHVRTERGYFGDESEAEGGPALMPATRVAIAEGIDHWSGEWMVREGRLFRCVHDCVAVGRVDAVRDDGRGLEVVPSARPSWIERWELVSGTSDQFHASARWPRREQDARRGPLVTPTIEPLHRTWIGTVDAAATQIHARAHEGLARATVAGVRVGSAWIALVHASSEPSSAVSVFVRDARGHVRLSGVVAGGIGLVHLDDVVEASPFGSDLGAVFLSVHTGSAGHDYDLGYVVELWAILPDGEDRLRVSTITSSGWGGGCDRFTESYDYEGWSVSIRTLGPRALRLGRVQGWSAHEDTDRHARTWRSAPPTPESEDDLPIATYGDVTIGLDATGFVEPTRSSSGRSADGQPHDAP